MTFALTAAVLVVPASADYSVQHNVAFNAKKINPYNGGPAWFESKTVNLLDESFGPVTVGPLNADPLGLVLETLFGVDLPHLVKLQTGASVAGHAKVDFGYYVTAGHLDISYPASADLVFGTEFGTNDYVRANATYGIDGSFLPGVSQRTVLPQFLETEGGVGYVASSLRSFSDYSTPGFTTSSPWASAWIEASADVQASIFTKVSALGGLKEWRKDIRAGGQIGGRLVEIDPTGLWVAGMEEPVVEFNVFEPIGPIPIGAGAAELTFQVPNLAVNSDTSNSPILHARKTQPLVTLTGNMERLIPFVGTILQNQIGPLGYDLLNLAGGPQISLYQDMTFTPDPQVRLNFSEPVLIDNVQKLEHTFALGDNIEWTPLFSNSNEIRVVPTYLLNNTFRNETGLALELVVDVEALSITANFPPFNGTLGPAYNDTVTIPLGNVKLFAPEFNIPLAPVTGGKVLLAAPAAAIVLQKSNVDVHPGFGDLKLDNSFFVMVDPQDPAYHVYQLEFSRAVEVGPPQTFVVQVPGTASFPQWTGEDQSSLFEAVNNVVLADPDTQEPINVGRHFCLSNCDLSSFLPDASPGYYDAANPDLGFLYLTELPDDLTFVPGVDLDVNGHPVLDNYSGDGDFVNDQTIEFPGEIIDRRDGPSSTILARTREFVPEGGGELRTFDAFTMNDHGELVFNSRLDLLTGSNGYYFADEEGKTKLVRSGDPVPGGGTISTTVSNQSSANSLGQVAFRSPISSNTPSDVGVFRAGPDGLMVIARRGQAAPDGSGTFIQIFPGSTNSLNDVGQVALWAEVTHPVLGTHEAILVGDGTSLTQIARQGDFAPGMSEGTMQSFGYFSLNNSGQTAFDVYTTTNVQGLYVHDGNGLNLIARDGASVPGGGLVVGIYDHVLNEVGQVAFAAGTRAFPGANLEFGIFRGDADGQSLVSIAREGQLAPDGDGTLMSAGMFSFRMNDAGQVAYRGIVNAAVDYQAVFVGEGGDLVQIARAGMTAPDGSGEFLRFDLVELNNRGHLAFPAVVSNTPGGDEERGIYLFDGVTLVEVVRPGQPLAGSTVTHAGGAGINDNMQVSYRAQLADGRSVIARFEPHLYWRNIGSGDWETGDSWSLGFAPRQPYDVFIIAENQLTVAGPHIDRTVKSLTVGGQDSAEATLMMESGVTLTATNGTTIRMNGVVTGTGTLAGNVTNEGAISPGASPGTLHIDGDYTQSSTGNLIVEIASDTVYDKLAVSGNITLGGAVSVSLLNGYVPTEGQTFSIFGDEFTAVAGAFESILFPTFEGLTFAVSQSLGAFNLQVVPSVGDFNHDGVVDGADFLVWQRSGSLDDLNLWRAHYGQSIGGGAGAIGLAEPLHRNVPEPSSILLLVFAAALVPQLRVDRVRSRPRG